MIHPLAGTYETCVTMHLNLIQKTDLQFSEFFEPTIFKLINFMIYQPYKHTLMCFLKKRKVIVLITTF